MGKNMDSISVAPSFISEQTNLLIKTYNVTDDNDTNLRRKNLNVKILYLREVKRTRRKQCS